MAPQPAEVPVTPHLAKRTSRELDVLAFVAEAVRLGDEPSKSRHTKDLGIRREDKVKGKRSARKRPTGQDLYPIRQDTDSGACFHSIICDDAQKVESSSGSNPVL